MRFGFYNEFRPCLVRQDGVIDISELVGAFPGAPPQCVLETLINKFDQLRSALQEAQSNGKTIPLSQVRLRAPVPRPGKVLCGRRNFKEGVPLIAGAAAHFLQSPDAVIGPGETVILPAFRASVFNHEAELALVIGKEAKGVSIDRALDQSSAIPPAATFRLAVRWRERRNWPALTANVSTLSCRSGRPSSRPTRLAIRTSSGSVFGSMVNCARTTALTTWSTVLPS